MGSVFCVLASVWLAADDLAERRQGLEDVPAVELLDQASIQAHDSTAVFARANQASAVLSQYADHLRDSQLHEGVSTALLEPLCQRGSDGLTRDAEGKLRDDDG